MNRTIIGQFLLYLIYLMFEKCINHQLLQYFDHDQSAFRKGHSTGTALDKLVDDLLDNINEGMMDAILFII